MTDSAQQSVAPAVGARFHVGADIEKAPIDDTLDELAVRPEQGLSSDEARQRLNQIPPQRSCRKTGQPPRSCQAENPLISLCRFARPVLSQLSALAIIAIVDLSALSEQLFRAFWPNHTLA